MKSNSLFFQPLLGINTSATLRFRLSQIWFPIFRALEEGNKVRLMDSNMSEIKQFLKQRPRSKTKHTFGSGFFSILFFFSFHCGPSFPHPDKMQLWQHGNPLSSTALIIRLFRFNQNIMSEKSSSFSLLQLKQEKRKKKDQSDSPLNYKQDKFKVRRCHFRIAITLHRRALLYWYFGLKIR